MARRDPLDAVQPRPRWQREAIAHARAGIVGVSLIALATLSLALATLLLAWLAVLILG